MSEEPQTWHYGLVARWWAEFNKPDPAELAFYQGFIEGDGQPALDLACGTGRLLLPLLRAGLDVDGCDLSPDMLAQCRQQAKTLGQPGLEKRLARYAQLSSRVGFVHHFPPLGEEELRFVLTHKWAELGLSFAPDDYTDAEALAAIARITAGNFRLVQRLFAQIARVLRVARTP